MRIAFSCNDPYARTWIDDLRAAMPDAQIDEWVPGAPPADFAVVWKPSQQMLDEQPRLKALLNIGAGVDPIMKLKLPPQTKVVRVDDGGMGVQMAEFVSHAVIRHFRGLAACDADQSAAVWQLRPPIRRADFPIGVMGLGVLGERVARTLSQFDYTVNGWSRSPKAIPGVHGFTGAAEFDAFLAATRCIVCLLPLTPDTRGILNTATLSKLQPGGYVVNVARGEHLVEEDLIPLLDTGRLAGASLDVFRTEPLPAGHPFWAHPKITVTPHTSARTVRDETIAQIARKIVALSRGEAVAGTVDRQKGY